MCQAMPGRGHTSPTATDAPGWVRTRHPWVICCSLSQSVTMCCMCCSLLHVCYSQLLYVMPTYHLTLPRVFSSSTSLCLPPSSRPGRTVKKENDKDVAVYRTNSLGNPTKNTEQVFSSQYIRTAHLPKCVCNRKQLACTYTNLPIC